MLTIQDKLRIKDALFQLTYGHEGSRCYEDKKSLAKEIYDRAFMQVDFIYVLDELIDSLTIDNPNFNYEFAKSLGHLITEDLVFYWIGKYDFEKDEQNFFTNKKPTFDLNSLSKEDLIELIAQATQLLTEGESK